MGKETCKQSTCEMVRPRFELWGIEERKQYWKVGEKWCDWGRATALKSDRVGKSQGLPWGGPKQHTVMMKQGKKYS
jgi:hypothetical protein